ncbi:MAG: hypothetical protein LBI42_13020 [Chitinispirillales bacterium]|jgi:hypothetical protein|nr:hypothetical protein [Chitinispirillales bacterium]
METRKCDVESNNPDSEDVYDFLLQSGFAFCAGIATGLQMDTESTYTLKQFTWVNDNEIDKILKVIEQQVNLFPGARNNIMENIAEMIDNTISHSDSKLGCFVIAQAYPESKRIRFGYYRVAKEKCVWSGKKNCYDTSYCWMCLEGLDNSYDIL